MFFVPQWQHAAVTNPTIAQNRAVVYGFVPYTCPAVTIQVTVHRPLYREAFSCRKHENPEAASAIWGRMLHICASRSVLLDTERTVTFLLHPSYYI